jgi:thioredoxin 1
VTYIGIPLLAIILLLFVFQWHLVRKSRKIIGQVIPELPPEIDEKLHSHGKILLYFFSPNCGPCRKMTPRIDRAMSNHPNVFKIDVSQSIDLARRLGVMATPTTVCISGNRIDRIDLGTLSDSVIEQLIA